MNSELPSILQPANLLISTNITWDANFLDNQTKNLKSVQVIDNTIPNVNYNLYASNSPWQMAQTNEIIWDNSLSSHDVAINYLFDGSKMCDISAAINSFPHDNEYNNFINLVNTKPKLAIKKNILQIKPHENNNNKITINRNKIDVHTQIVVKYSDKLLNIIDTNEYIEINEIHYFQRQNVVSKQFGIKKATFSARWRKASGMKKWPFLRLCAINKKINLIFKNITVPTNKKETIEEKSNDLASLLKEKIELTKPVKIKIN